MNMKGSAGQLPECRANAVNAAQLPWNSSLYCLHGLLPFMQTSWFYNSRESFHEKVWWPLLPVCYGLLWHKTEKNITLSLQQSWTCWYRCSTVTRRASFILRCVTTNSHYKYSDLQHQIQGRMSQYQTHSFRIKLCLSFNTPLTRWLHGFPA